MSQSLIDVVLTAKPDSDVVFNVTSDNTTDATVSSGTLTFTSGNWDTPKSVTVSAIDDTINGNGSATITIAVDDASSDDDFDSLSDQTVAVTITDDEPTAVNDIAAVTPSQSVVIDVLANDIDPQDDTLIIVAITIDPSAGTATITDTGKTITYTAGSEKGSVTFDYRISDENGGTAEATVTITVSDIVTIGSLIDIDASEIANMDNEFTKKPVIYGKYNDPVSDRDMKATTKCLTKISAKAQNNKFECEWSRGIYLYDKRARLAANKLGKSTAQWISELLPNNKIDDLQVNLWAKTTNVAREKIDAAFRGILMTSPVITEITGWDGGVFSGLHTKSVITIKGTYFGNKAPLVSLEYLDPIKGVLIKQQRLKVLRPYKYSDSKGNIEKSCMDLSSGKGASEIQVELPIRWWRGWEADSYDLILDNKIGLATYTVSTIASSVSNPVANDDTVTLIHGDASYYIDVLADNGTGVDTDANSDNMKIILTDKVSNLGGRIAVSKGKIRYTPPRGVLPNAFPDEFTYTLSDIHGGVSASPATVTINMNAITLDPVKHWDGTALTIGSRTVQPGSRIILSGSNFGVRVPIVTMAVENDKILKLKVVSKAQYVDYKGKAKNSYTDLSTGDSEITVEFPKKAWIGYENSKVYTITVTNKFDTNGVGQSVTTSDGNTTPTATPDSVDLYSGEKCYYIDVLGNNSSSTSVVFTTNGVDTDEESDKLTIILPLKKSLLGAKLIVDRITNTIKYTRVKGELCTFSDSFDYSLMDTNGATSETVTVTITGKLAP